jgi:hypothetical protein
LIARYAQPRCRLKSTGLDQLWIADIGVPQQAA